MTGICKHCGQLVSVDDITIRTEEEANEYASNHCSCPEAAREYERLAARDRAAKERDQALTRAQEQIDDLFGEGAAGYGLLEVKEEIRELMHGTATLIYDNNMKDATMNINSCVKVKISKSSKGKLIFMRSDAAVYKQEA